MHFKGSSYLSAHGGSIYGRIMTENGEYDFKKRKGSNKDIATFGTESVSQLAL